MPKPELNVNTRAYGYLLLGEVLELVVKRAESCLDLKNDSADLLMTIIEDTIGDFRADVSDTKVHFKEDGSFKLESDVLAFLGDTEAVDEETLALTLSMILERLDGLEGKVKNMNG
jgi:hypothetical protein